MQNNARLPDCFQALGGVSAEGGALLCGMAFLGLSRAALVAFTVQLTGYIALSTLIQSRWYSRRAGREAKKWRCQPAVPPHAPDSGSAGRWSLPALELASPPKRPASAKQQPPRHPRHAQWATLNLLVSACFAGAVAEATQRGRALTLECGREGCALSVLNGLVLSLALQSVLEMYWHWLMHTGICYRLLHRHHHFYKAPQVWDDLCIHPAEAFGYYCILYCPALLIPRLHVASFLLYMAVCGLLGVLDHSGVSVKLFGYDSRVHDEHHRLGFGAGVHINLAFPFTLLDRLHGTYVGPTDAVIAD